MSVRGVVHGLGQVFDFKVTGGGHLHGAMLGPYGLRRDLIHTVEGYSAAWD